MNGAGVKFVIDPPDWPIVLTVCAAAILAAELAMLLRRLWSGRSQGAAVAFAVAALLPGVAAAAGALFAGWEIALAALTLGPLLAAAVGAWGLLTTPAGRPLKGRGLLVGVLRGTLVAGLALAAAYWPRAGSIAAIAACSLAWAVRAYARTTSPLRLYQKRLLLALRIAVVLLLAGWLVRPVLQYSRTRLVPAVVLVGVDTSASMQRRDMPADYTAAELRENAEPVRRIDSVRAAVKDQEEAFRALTDQCDLSLFAFSASVQPLALLPSRRTVAAEPPPDAFTVPQAAGPATAVGDCLAQAFSPYVAGAPEVVAILLVTDGCNNTSDVVDPRVQAELLGARGVPIFAVGVGSDKVLASTRRLTVKDLLAPDQIDAFHRLPITASIDTLGLDGRTIKVICRFGDQEVGSETFVPAGKQDVRPVRFAHVPLAAGFQRLTVSAEVVGPLPADLEGQMSADKLVQVLDRELRILYVEGRFRYESKYIAQALSGERRFSLDRRILLAPPGAQESPALSENPDEWLRYHAIILGDVEASHFSARQIQIIRELVSDKGKGFCMIGGRRSFAAGGWADTPLADVLPVNVKQSEGELPAGVRVVPTPEGLKNEMMRIAAAADPAAAWASLDPLDGANVLGPPKPGAVVLAAAGGGEPLIVAQRYGAGRALAIAFDTTWNWVLSAKDTAESQRRFWRQVALYLAAPKGNVWIATDKSTYEFRRLVAPDRAGQRSAVETVEVSAGVEDASGLPAPGSLKTVTLTKPGGEAVPIELQRSGDVLKGTLPPPAAPGLHVLNIAAEVDGKPLTAEHRFEIVQMDLEARDVLANFALLREIATASKGKFVRLAELPALLKELRTAARPRRRAETTPVDLGNAYRWPLAVVLIALLCAEWSLRKRGGLV